MAASPQRIRRHRRHRRHHRRHRHRRHHLATSPSACPCRWRSKKAKLESQKAKARNEYRAKVAKLKRRKGLHPAAKWKRIISQTNFWFSDTNLCNDDWLVSELSKDDGWITIR